MEHFSPDVQKCHEQGSQPILKFKKMPYQKNPIDLR